MAYYGNITEQELGFDAFIAPDDFDRTAQPVDIYEVFKREYVLNNQARYIYYYSDGNYPLTLTPTADEYYKYGYTQGGSDIVVDVALNAAPVTIFGETLTTKRWVIVYRVSTAKFELTSNIFNLVWLYLGDKCQSILFADGTHKAKFIHCANINSLVQILGTYTAPTQLQDKINIPETVGGFPPYAFRNTLLTKFNFPNTKKITGINWQNSTQTLRQFNALEFHLGGTTDVSFNDKFWGSWPNLRILSCAEQNTAFFSSFGCDILFTKDKAQILWVANKTARGVCLPDELPQSQLDTISTKFRLGWIDGNTSNPVLSDLSTNIMQNHQLYIGTQITDLTNLYLANKSFVTIEVGAGNTAFSVQNGLLISATGQLIKAGTYNTGNLIIPNGVTEILANSFLRCNGYTGNLSIPSSVTSIALNSLNVLTQLTSLTLPLNYDTSIYNYFGFANFSAESLNTSILNLMGGTSGSPKWFIISKTSLDALNAAYPDALSNAALRFINVLSQLPTRAPIDYLMLMEGTPMDNSSFITTSGTPVYNTGGDYLGVPMMCVTGANFETLSRVDLSNTNKISLSFWLKVNPSVKTTIMNTDTVSSHRMSATMPNGYWIDSSLTIQDWGTNTTPLNILQTSGAINNGVWRHFVVTKDRALNHPNEWKLYVNGVSTTFNYPSPHTVDYSTNFKNWLFQIYSSNCFISRFKVYGRILNQTEVTQLYNDIFL